MKTILISSVLSLLFYATYGQSNDENNSHWKGNSDNIQSILGTSGHNGFYGAVTFKGTEFDDKSIPMLGMRGAWVVNRTLGIGLDLNGLIPTRVYNVTDGTNEWKARAVGGYGGFLLEPIIFSNNIVHATFPISTGAGWLGYVRDWEEDYDSNEDDYIDGDVFWYIEPGVSVEMNVTNFFRINLGASRRIVQDFNLQDTKDNAFDTWAYTLSLKFGRF